MVRPGILSVTVPADSECKGPVIRVFGTNVIYRDLARPKSPEQTAPRAKQAATEAQLTRDDVTAILQRTRGASSAELEQVISNAKEYNLTPDEKNQLSVDLTIQIAHARQSNGRRERPGEYFIGQILGLVETPFGIIEREWIDGLLRDGAQSIARCKTHRPPECPCWSASRAILWQANTNGEKTPEGWAASRIYDFLAGLESAPRPEREPAEPTSFINRESKEFS